MPRSQPNPEAILLVLIFVEAKSVKYEVDKKSISEIYKSSGVEISGVKYVQDDDVRVK